MKINMGLIDRIVRIIIAIGIVILYFSSAINGVWAVILLVVAGIFLITSVIGFCQLYTVFKWNTKTCACCNFKKETKPE